MTTSALRAMLTSDRLSPLVDDNALLAAMLRFEAALVRAQAD